MSQQYQGNICMKRSIDSMCPDCLFCVILETNELSKLLQFITGLDLIAPLGF